MAQETYYFGQGKVFIRTKSADPAPWRWLGDVSELTLAAAGEEKLKHKENYSGRKNTVRSISFGGDLALSATLFQIDNQNLAMAARGTITDVAPGTVASEVLGTAEAGDVFMLENGYNVTNMVISDAVSTAIDAEHYDYDARTGMIEILSLPATLPTFPLSASYEHKGAKGVVLFNNLVKDLELRYVGINLAENNASVILELYKLSPGNLQSLSFISADTSALANMPWAADVLVDSTKPANGALGQVGRFLQVNEA